LESFNLRPGRPSKGGNSTRDNGVAIWRWATLRVECKLRKYQQIYEGYGGIILPRPPRWGPSLTPLDATLFPSGSCVAILSDGMGRTRMMPSAERKERIGSLIDQTHAALLNARREWHEKGETAALRSFVDTLGLASQR